MKHLSSFPYCPITNTPLNFEDLIDVVRKILLYLSISITSKSSLRERKQFFE
jgi:hypothetical protein